MTYFVMVLLSALALAVGQPRIAVTIWAGGWIFMLFVAPCIKEFNE